MTAAVNIVQLRPQQTMTPSRSGTLRQRIECWSDSWAGEPAITLPDLPPELAAALPEAIEEAKREMAPSDPGEILVALTTMASRKGLPVPDDIALEMDVEILAAWPRDLWRRAFRAVWEGFTYRRFPEVGDFRKHIVADLNERQARLHRLESLCLKLETVRLREQWDVEAAARRSPAPGPAESTRKPFTGSRSNTRGGAAGPSWPGG
jgi:hypothetical protein